MDLLAADTSIIDDLQKIAEDVTAQDAPKQKWSEMVLGKLYAAHPFLHPYNVSLTFRHVKPQDDYAAGTVVVTKDGQKWVYIPFIIEAGDLKPLDVMSDGERYHYLTEERVQGVLETPNSDFMVAKRPPVGGGDFNTGGTGGSGTSDMNTYRDADSFLNKVSSGTSKAVLSKRFDDLFKRDDRLGELFGEKRAAVEGRSLSTESALAVQVSEDGEAYAIRVLHSDGSIEKESAIYTEVKQLLGDVPETRLTAPINSRFVADQKSSDIVKVAVEGMSSLLVNTSDGREPAVGFEDTFNLFGNRLEQPTVIGRDFSVSGEVYGILQEKSAALDFSPARGRGVFVFERGVTVPVTIKASYIDGGVEKLSYVDELGFDGIIEYSDVLVPQRVDNTVYIPKTARFISASEEKESLQEEEKEADITLSNYGSTMKLSGRVETADVTSDEMELILVGLGCPALRAEGLIKRAQVVGSAEVGGLGDFDSSERIFVETPELLDASIGLFETMKEAGEQELEIIKQATGVLPADTVDAVLGLQLVSQELLEETRNCVPMFEKTQDKLAELLLLSRLGVVLRGKDGVILRVVKGLDNLMGGLRTLEAGF